jgi:hypothetical protein
MLLIAYVAVAVFGFVAIMKGRVKLSEKSICEGTPARVAGVILLLPWPLGFVIGLAASPHLRDQAALTKFVEWAWIVDVVLLVAALVAATIIVSVTARRSAPSSVPSGAATT